MLGPQRHTRHTAIRLPRSAAGYRISEQAKSAGTHRSLPGAIRMGSTPIGITDRVRRGPGHSALTRRRHYAPGLILAAERPRRCRFGIAPPPTTKLRRSNPCRSRCRRQEPLLPRHDRGCERLDGAGPGGTSATAGTKSRWRAWSVISTATGWHSSWTTSALPPAEALSWRRSTKDDTGHMTFTSITTEPLPLPLVEAFIAEARSRLNRTDRDARTDSGPRRRREPARDRRPGGMPQPRRAARA